MQTTRITAIAVLGLFSLSISVTGCGDDEDKKDASVDSGVKADTGTTFADAGPSVDSGPRPDTGTGPRDAGHFCIENDEVQVDGTTVSVGTDPTEPPTNPAGQASGVGCIDERPSSNLANPTTYTGCLEFFGPVATQTEIDELRIDLFRSYLQDGTPVDPSFDPITGSDRANEGHLFPDVIIEAVQDTICPSELQIIIGRDASAVEAPRTDLEHILRIKSSTTTGTWVTTYVLGINKRADVGSVIDLILVRKTELQTLVSGMGIPGSQDLSDFMGSGYAFVEALDCLDIPMTHAVVGFSPAPDSTAYLTGAGAVMAGATETGGRGLYAGFGFTNNSTTARPVDAFGAVGITRDGTCNEEFAGTKFMVYSDSITFARIGREVTLNP